MNVVDLSPTYDGFELVQNRVLLGNRIGFKPQYMAYADVKREKLQLKKELVDGSKVRVVYRSRSPLCFIQQRLGTMLSFAFDRMEGTEPAIACRKGLNVRELLADKCTSPAVLVKTDIRKYYDHVTRRKLKECLGRMGFVEAGPEVISRYLLVGRHVEVVRHGEKVPRYLQTLQQGSSASPVVANIVGKLMFDDPILDWLKKNMPVPYQYYRYSDNISILLDKDPGREVTESYKKFVRELAEGDGYSTHSWATVRPNNKGLAQKFLGVVLNQVAGIERRMRDRTRAIMYSAILGGVQDAAVKYCDLFGIAKDDMSPEEMAGRFAASINGYAAYVGSVNPKHGLRLTKLSKVLNRLVDTGAKFDTSKKDLLNRYRLDTESTAEFLRKLGDYWI